MMYRHHQNTLHSLELTSKSIFCDNKICIYFGDRSDQLFMHEPTYTYFKQAPALLDIKPFDSLRAIMPINHLLFARQVHGTTGFNVDHTTAHSIKPFAINGDYLITNAPGIGIGVLTADCLPIVLHDTMNHAIAVIHAGWRGSVEAIAMKALQHMASAFGTLPSDVRVFFGPCACRCCYSVGPEVTNAIEPYQNLVLERRDNKTYFDIAEYNSQLLQKSIRASAISGDYAQCTICNDQFWSYRRQQHLAGRQMTVVLLV